MSFGSYYLIPTMFFFFEVGGGGEVGWGLGTGGMTWEREVFLRQFFISVKLTTMTVKGFLLFPEMFLG